MANGTVIIDPSGFGALPATQITGCRQYLAIVPSSFLLTPGATNTVYAIGSTSENGGLVLPYYNASQPNQPYAGPANSGTSQPTVQQDIATVAVTTGAVPIGGIPLYSITVPSGSSGITASMVSFAAGARFYPSIPSLLTRANFATFTSTQIWTVPSGVFRARGKAWSGGGGGGGSGNASSAGSGAEGGNFADFILTNLSPGQQISIMVGSGGLGSAFNGQNATAGGSTIIAGYLNLIGGNPGVLGNGTSALAGTASTVGTVFGSTAGGVLQVGQSSRWHRLSSR